MPSDDTKAGQGKIPPELKPFLDMFTEIVADAILREQDSNQSGQIAGSEKEGQSKGASDPMQKLKEHYQNLDQLISQASKEQLAECARLLALSVAHYKSKYGQLPLEEHLDMLQATDIDQDLAKLLASGVLEMAVVLALVMGRLEEYERLKAEGTSVH